MKPSPFWMWLLTAAVASIAILGSVAIPNYRKAAVMRADSRTLSKAADQYLVQRNEFARLGTELDRLRSQRDESGHALRSDLNESRLVPSLTRPIDGTEVLDQSIRIGDRESLNFQTVGFSLDKRVIDLQMTGSFDALFSTLRAAEDEAGMTRVRTVDMHRNGSQVQASVGIDEFFRSSEGKR
ncbi:MAG: hypothetical protein EXS15_04820 [Phycisphaerales bacterium]|nr:hypothetical protein [Phycisphaerales bacterium]